MDCNRVEAMLADYLGAELNDNARVQVEAHLDGCTACASEVRELQGTVATLAQLDSVTPAEASTRTQGLQITHRASLPRRIILSSLRIAAVLLLGVYLGRISQSQQPSPEQSPRGGGKTVAVAQPGKIHPKWIELAQRMDRNASGLTGSLQYLARGLNR